MPDESIILQPRTSPPPSLRRDESTLKGDSYDSERSLPLPVLTETVHRASTSKTGLLVQDEPLRRPEWVKRLFTRILSNNRVAKVERWARGPVPPREFTVEPFFPRIEGFFNRLFGPLRNPFVIFPFCFIYIIGLAELVKLSQFSATTSEGPPTFISGTSSYWSPNGQCGLDGTACAPFDNTSFPFRCPANTASVQLLNPRAVGADELIFQPLIVGGGDADGTYRADSFICQSAIHHGLFRNGEGGCGVVNQVGAFTGFIGSDANDLSSVSFDSEFPSAYRFDPLAGSRCKDLRDEILAYNVVMLFLLSFVLRPPAAVFYWASICVGFWQISLISSQMGDIANAFGRFLPALFFCYAFWRIAFRWTLPHFSGAVIERTVLFLGPFWVSVLSDLTWEKIPLQRLLPEDIRKQPGGLVALIILVLIIFVCALLQFRVMRLSGWLVHYLRWYAFGGVCLGLLSTAPRLTIRIHHYIIATAFIPATAWPTRLSLLFQGLLLGLFIDGASRWGFDSLVNHIFPALCQLPEVMLAQLQTAEELRGDAALGTDLPSFANTSATFVRSATTIAFNAIPANLTESYDGFALLVDDVLRQQGPELSYSTAGLRADLPHYFRLAYTFTGSLGDFTKAATWLPNGSFIDPLPGPS